MAERKQQQGRFIVWGLVWPLWALSAYALFGPPSVEAALCLCTCSTVLVGRSRRSRGAVLIGGVSLAVLVMFRLLFAGAGEMRSTRAASTAWLDRLVPERDLALGASRIVLWSGAVTEPGLLAALDDGYSRMRAEAGVVPSPVLSNFLLPQSAEAHQRLEFGEDPMAAGVAVFLHGSMGGVALECWQVAQIVQLPTICPSGPTDGDWTAPAGHAIIEQTLGEIAPDRRIVLIGLSAGGISLSQTAHRYEVDGVILISGVARRARRSGHPTLVLHGRADSMARAGPARAFARRSRGVRYREHPTANHWLLLTEHEWLAQQVRPWLMRGLR